MVIEETSRAVGMSVLKNWSVPTSDCTHFKSAIHFVLSVVLNTSIKQ